MSTLELQRRLIEKIQVTDDDNLLEEASRLLEVELDESAVYILSESQKRVIEEARQEIKRGEYLTDDASNKEIDEWLNK